MKVRREGDEMREKTEWRALAGAQSYEQYGEYLEGARAVFSRLSVAAAEDS